MSGDEGYLLQMLIAARDVREVASEIARERLATRKLDQLALAKAVELVGEAAARVSEETRRIHHQIPWRKMVGMRHRLVHDYRNLDLNILWAVVQTEIPSLIEQLEQIVPPEEEA